MQMPESWGGLWANLSDFGEPPSQPPEDVRATCHVTLGKTLGFQNLSSLTCKMGILVPTSQGSFQENLLSVKARCPCKL